MIRRPLHRALLLTGIIALGGYSYTTSAWEGVTDNDHNPCAMKHNSCNPCAMPAQ